ncbi:MAG: serine hydrolase domain-containing protein [Acidimicrobiales bacterium]
MTALDAIEGLGAERAAAAIVTASGRVELAGDLEHRFALASVTKLFVAYAALIAYEEHTLALNDPAGPPGSTVAHLLAHSSGLAPDEPRAIAAPGTRRIYSNAGFEVLAEVIEQASDLSIEEYLSSGIFQPIGMSDADLEGSPASGAMTTIEDCALFARELIAPRLISRSTLSFATRVAFPGLAGVLPGFGRQDPCDWGLGFEIRDAKSPHWTGASNSAATYGHFGQSGTFLWVDPDVRAAFVLLTNRDFGDWAIDAWPRLSDQVLSDIATG